MAYVIDRQTREISTMDTVAALAQPERYVVYHKREIPLEVVAAPLRYRVIDGDSVRLANALEQLAADQVLAEHSRVEQKQRRNDALEAAAVIVEQIDATLDPVLLAVRELVFVLMEELQAIKGNKPKPPKPWEEHKASTAARLRARKAQG